MLEDGPGPCARCGAPDGEPRLVSPPTVSTFADDLEDDDDDALPHMVRVYVCRSCAGKGDHGAWIIGHAMRAHGATMH